MPKVINKQKKKDKIIKAAVKVFAKKGFFNTKMVDIAEAAEIGKGTIYEYFKNKDDIFKYGYQNLMHLLKSTMTTDISKTADPVDKLRAIFSGWADILAGEHQDIIVIIIDFWAEAVREKSEDKLKIINMEKTYADYRSVIKSILDEGIQKGKFRRVNSYLTASLLLGTLDGIMLQWILNPNVFDIREAIKCLIDEFLVGICPHFKGEKL